MGSYTTACRLPIEPWDGEGALRGQAVRSLEACGASERTATFDVTFMGFPAAAETAFRAALDTWSCRISSTVPIRVQASWTPLSATTLGNAGPFLFRNFPLAPRRDTWYPAPLADHFAGRDLNPGQPDIQAEFNSTFDSWHLDVDSQPSANQYDFYTVVLHEIGHGLGFIGALTVENGRGQVGSAENARGAYVFDRYTLDRQGVSLLNASVYPDNSVALADALRSRVLFSGRAVERVQSGPAELYAPSVWSSGASYSHLDEALFPRGTNDGLMTPFVTRGESYDEPGGVTCAILFEIGWTLSGGCAALVGDGPRVREGLQVSQVGPNPFLSQTTVQIVSPTSQRVRVLLADALGREVEMLHDATVEAEVPVDVLVRARTYAAGVYRVVVTGEQGAASRSLVLLR